MPYSSSVNDLFGGVNDPYSVTASIGDQGLSTTNVSGDRETDAFKDGNEMDKDSFLLLLKVINPTISLDPKTLSIYGTPP